MTFMLKRSFYGYRGAHEKWLSQGDQNTASFHKVANGRKRKNTIPSLEEGDWLIEGTSNLLKHATEYYK